MEIREWVLENLLAPQGPGIAELEDTYPWKSFLRGVNTTALYRALMPMVRGAIFTGQPGNGRHTQAFAFAYSLVEQNAEDLAKACFFLIEPGLLSPEDEEKELLVKVKGLYEVLESLLEDNYDTIAVIFDQIDLYPHRMMERIAEQIINQDSDRLFTICIGQSESNISRYLLRELIHCRCLNPSPERRKNYLQQIELLPVEDNWTDPSNPKEKNISLEFEGITLEKIVELTESCSYADLADLLWLLKLYICNSDISAFENTDNLVVRLEKEAVLDAIGLCKPAPSAEHAGQILPVPQALPMHFLFGGNQIQHNNSSNATDDTGEVLVDDAMNMIEIG